MKNLNFMRLFFISLFISLLPFNIVKAQENLCLFDDAIALADSIKQGKTSFSLYTKYHGKYTISLKDLMKLGFRINTSNLSPKEKELYATLTATVSIDTISPYDFGKNTGETKKTEPTILSSFSGLSFISSPATLIDQTSQFLVERTKQELNIAFVDKFRDAFKKNKDLQYLFPSVTSIVLYNDPLNFSTWNNQFQMAIEKDLNDMPINITVFIKNDKLYDSLSLHNKELLELSFVVLQAIQCNKSGYSPTETLNLINQAFGYSDSKTLVINKTISLTQAVSESFYRDSVYVQKDEIQKFSNDSIKRKIFFSLFASKYESLLNSIQFSNPSLFRLLFSNPSDNRLNNIFLYACQLINNYEIIEPSIDSIRSIRLTDSEKISEIIKINNYLIEEFDLGFKIYYILRPEEYLRDNGWYIKYRPIIKGAVDLSNDLLLKNYRSAMVSFNTMLANSLNYIAIDLDLDLDSTKSDKINKTKDLLNNAIYWGGFLTEFMLLDSTNTFNDLLKKYAAPVSSYRIKRNHCFSASVNAYPGIFGGTEKITNSDKSWVGPVVTAPIGLSMNFRIRKNADKYDFDFVRKSKYKYSKGNTIGLYMTLIDIGAPFAYRWSNDTTKGFPAEIKWEQVFSPGAYLTWGFKNSGLTFMAGGQYAPQLRKVTENALVLKENAFRFGLSVCYDIPLFTLCKSRR